MQFQVSMQSRFENKMIPQTRFPYEINHLTLEQRKELLSFSKEKCSSWWVDEIDISKSAHRQKIDMSYEDIMSKFDMTSYLTVISREPYAEDPYLEVCFSTAGETTQFLWMKLDPKIATELRSIFGISLISYENLPKVDERKM